MNIYLDMVGCRLNQSEIENYASQFRFVGHSLVAEAESADMIVINTCTVTAAAASDSRQKIRHASRIGLRQIIVTGCLATLNPSEIAMLPGVTRVIPNDQKDDLVPIVLNLPIEILHHASLSREPIPGNRLRTRAFIKVQDGCDNHCTYCVTRLARGAGRSRSIEDVQREIRSALEGGSQEIVLTGVHLGSWGYDFPTPSHLQNLVRAILVGTEIPRLRLSSIEPWDISSDFFELWQDSRLCRHLHLPLQSGSGSTLQRMGRRITPQAYAELIHRARLAIPDVAITTDLIAGFPGETEDNFNESASFIKEMEFSGGHVFTYSLRPGTAAEKMPDKVSYPLAKQRNAVLRQIIQHSALDYHSKHLNHDVKVLWEKVTPVNNQGWQLSGLSDNYLRVRSIFSSPCRNKIMNVHITGVENDSLVGDVSPP